MKKNIAIFLHHPKCSVESVNGIVRALSPQYNIKIFTRHAVQDGFFDDVEMVIYPGGEGDADSFEYLLKENIDAIKNFLSQGGKYLGICMGAYWADAYYFDILQDTRVVQYIKRPQADVTHSYGTTVPIRWQGQDKQMYFYDGCCYTNGEFKTIATYANGDPMAIIQGSVGLLGCHLESEQSWYLKKNQQPHWHRGEHHLLLLEFVNALLTTPVQEAHFPKPVRGEYIDWIRGYLSLLDYVKEHQTTNVPHDYIDTKGFLLGQWVAAKRQSPHAVDEYQQQKLNSLPHWQWQTPTVK